MLTALAVLLVGCGGGDDGGGPAPQTQSTGPGPLDEGGIICEIVAILLGGECVGVGNAPTCSDDPWNNLLGLPDCGGVSASVPVPGLWPRAPSEIIVSEPTNLTVTLDWIPPSTYTDGTILTAIDGYQIFWTLFPNEDWATAGNIYLQNPGLSAYVLDLPVSGVWYIRIATVANGGNGGPLSDAVSVQVL